MKFTVGCPILGREEIFPRWNQHLITAAEAASLTDDLNYIFVVNRGDNSMIDMILETTIYPTKIVEIKQELPSKERVWNEQRYHEMVKLRNSLLRAVRKEQPDLFLSLDSDILLHSRALCDLLETSQNDCAAVGGKTYMTERGTGYPSYANINNTTGALVRSDTTGVIPVEVIMAIKLLKPEAYEIDYEYDNLGEDIGWSKAVRAKGHQLYFDGRLANKHVMKEEMLDVVDGRCGF